MKRLLCFAVLLTISSAVFAGPVQGTREVLLENDDVQVVRLTYPPGTESGMHTHQYPHRVVYFVKGGNLQLVPADPQAETEAFIVDDGEAVYMPAVEHNVKNIGETELVILEVELK
jgi:mannose-6-phosphate isomerase-like protein (cupin superfamily)